LALIFFAWMNIRGATISGRLQYIFCVILVIGVVLITLGVFLHPSSSTANIGPAFNPEIPAWTAVLAIVAISPWAYAGFDNVPQAAEEFDFPAAKAFGIIIAALIVAAAIYSALIFATAAAMPWQDLVASEPAWGTGEAIAGLFGAFGILILAIALCMGIFTGMNGFFVSSSRLLFAMGRARFIPSIFSKLHSTHRTPYAGIMLTCGVCLIAPWFGREVLLWIVDMTATGVTIAYLYACLVAYKIFRWSDSGSVNQTNIVSVVAPVRKALSLLGAICAAGFLCLLVIPGSPGFLGIQSWIALFVWILLGVAFYLYKRRDLGMIRKQQLDYLILGDQSESEQQRVR
ncbi:MAG: APC family permease, partial [Rubrobacteraceae bacterium]